MIKCQMFLFFFLCVQILHIRNQDTSKFEKKKKKKSPKVILSANTLLNNSQWEVWITITPKFQLQNFQKW